MIINDSKMGYEEQVLRGFSMETFEYQRHLIIIVVQTTEIEIDFSSSHSLDSQVFKSVWALTSRRMAEWIKKLYKYKIVVAWNESTDLLLIAFNFQLYEV